MSLALVPISLVTANEHIGAWHRHHRPIIQSIFQVGAADDEGVLRAVAVAEWPRARSYGDGATIEITRVASDGTRNANSILYGACARAAFALGYRRVITYTEQGESGSSLRAAGYKVIAERPARAGWHTVSRPRDNSQYRSVQRQLWEVLT